MWAKSIRVKRILGAGLTRGLLSVGHNEHNITILLTLDFFINFQTLSELEKRKKDDSSAAEDDPARLQELREHLFRLGSAESKVIT